MGTFHALSGCFYNDSLFCIGDAFLIDEIALYEGERNEEVYAVAGDILDGVSSLLSFVYSSRTVRLPRKPAFWVINFYSAKYSDVFYFLSTFTISL